MSFSAPKWEKDKLGDETLTDLFKNSPKKKGNNASQKHKANISNIQNQSSAKISIPKSSKRKNESPQDDSSPVRSNQNKKRKLSNKKQKLKKKLLMQQSVDIRKTVKPFKLKENFNVQTKNVTKTLSEDEDKVIGAKQIQNKLKKKLKLQKRTEESSQPKSKPFNLNVDSLKDKLSFALKPKDEPLSLRDRMLERLRASRFRYLNEQLYTNDSAEAQKLFQNDPYAFEAYHEGYRQQVSKWPLNPVDKMISSIKKLSPQLVIVDFGCGEAKLAQNVPNKVHSFDLVSKNDFVTACDMAHCPLKNNSVDVAVFCLSLMGTNLKEYLLEANRVLKSGGVLKIADVESRFNKIEAFIDGLKKYGFVNTSKDFSNNMFYFLDFTKDKSVKNKNKLPTIELYPCLYKKR